MRGPTSARIAGSSVSAQTIAIATIRPVVRPSVVTSGMPATASEQTATTTVLPANRTAPPEVATARATDSPGSIPLESVSRWVVTMNSA